MTRRRGSSVEARQDSSVEASPNQVTQDERERDEYDSDLDDKERCLSLGKGIPDKCHDKKHKHMYVDEWFDTEKEAMLRYVDLDRFGMLQRRPREGKPLYCNCKSKGCHAHLTIGPVRPRGGKGIGLRGCLQHNHEIDQDGSEQLAFASRDEALQFFQDTLFEGTSSGRTKGNSKEFQCRVASSKKCKQKFSIKPLLQQRGKSPKRDIEKQIHVIQGVLRHNHVLEVKDKRIQPAVKKAAIEKMKSGVPPMEVFRSQEIPSNPEDVTDRPIMPNYMLKLHSRHVGRHITPNMTEEEGLLEWLKSDFVRAYHPAKQELHDVPVDVKEKMLEDYDDFVMVMMDERQREMLRKHPKVLFGDSTHGTNKHGLELMSFHVTVDNGMTYPVCHALTPTENKRAARACIEVMKDLEPEALGKTEVLVSDMSKSYALAWEEAGLQDVKHTVCGWHFKQVMNTFFHHIYILNNIA